MARSDENWKAMFNNIWQREGTSFIQFLFDAGLDANTLNTYGKTMLSYAAEWGDLELTEFLVQKGADGDIANSDGSKPLHVAAKYARNDIVKYFIDKGISANSCDDNNRTPLHSVCDISSVGNSERCREVVRCLVDGGADLESVSDGLAPLLLAAKNVREDLVQLFIQLGANVNCCNELQWTVLHFAARRGWRGIARSLLEGKCDIDVNARTSNGRTPLGIATLSWKKDIIDLLLKTGHCDSSEFGMVMHECCRMGWLDTLEYLVSRGSGVNALNEDGRSLLVPAFKHARKDIVQYLIEAGINVEDLGGETKRTALYLVSWGGWVDVAKSLIKKGADINAQDYGHSTPLHYAVLFRKTEIIRCLLEAGADWNLEDRNGCTAFHNSILKDWSAEQGIIVYNLEGIAVFIENGAYFQSKDYDSVISRPFLTNPYTLLQNVDLCTQLVINRFNNAELPKIYEIPEVAERIPSIERLKFPSTRNVSRDIAMCISHEIQTKGYCNIMNAPILLSCLCLRSLFKYYDK